MLEPAPQLLQRGSRVARELPPGDAELVRNLVRIEVTRVAEIQDPALAFVQSARRLEQEQAVIGAFESGWRCIGLM